MQIINVEFERSLSVTFKMTEQEAVDFIKASIPEAAWGIEVASFVDKIRKTLNEELYTSNMQKVTDGSNIDRALTRNRGM